MTQKSGNVTNEDLQNLRARLNAGPVIFFRDYLCVSYSTGYKYLSGESQIPGPVAMTVRMWNALLDSGQADAMKAALGITGLPKPYKRKPKDVDLSFLSDRNGTGYTGKSQ